MAYRPIFLPCFTGKQLVQEVQVSFIWHSGMAASQKKKNVAELHKEAALRGFKPLLEVSSKSERRLGWSLSSFNQMLMLKGRNLSVESAYQGSKVFEKGGPYVDLYEVSSREAKKDDRLRNSGRLKGFLYDGEDYPLSPTTSFYDWLYLNALYRNRRWLRRLSCWRGFTDIEFNPERSLNCQARSCAMFVALVKRDLLEDAIESFGTFVNITSGATV